MEINEEENVPNEDNKPQTHNVIRNISVSFPFTPYECQLQYMSKVLQALQEKTNAILESPTGTGKTLCLLCSVLAWRQQLSSSRERYSEQREAGSSNNGEFWDPVTGECFNGIPKIIYSSRTHAQLSQAINELKNTRYRPNVSIIGSREQMCINSEVMKKDSNAEKVHLCRAKVKSRACGYYNNLDVNKLSTATEKILDVEDLVLVGTRNRMCPYYLAREKMADAELIFMPYNYILDIKMRESHNINLQNAIVILDEAHNIERICEDSVSFDFTSIDFAHCIDDVDYMLRERMKEIGETTDEDEVQASLKNDIQEIINLKKMFLTLEETLNGIQLHSDQGSITKPGCFIFEFLKTANIIKTTYQIVIEQCEMAISYLTTCGQKVFKSGRYLQKFLDAVKIIFTQESSRSELNTNYKVFITNDSKRRSTDFSNPWQTSTSKNKEVRVLRFLCFCPAYAMKNLSEQGVRSIIITSGTLSPLDSFCKELKLEFPIRLEGSHVISSEQVYVGVLKKGCDNGRLNSAYEYRYSDLYLNSLGLTLVNISRVVPDGILVFFPSYPTLSSSFEAWQKFGIVDRIEQRKKIFKEPKRKAEFIATMDGYYQTIRDPSCKGAIFFAVCRGKVSEGLDFADDVGRAVIVTGIPFPPTDDPKIKLKMEYFNEVQPECDDKSNPNPPGSSKKLFKAGDWYRQQAIRAVNQAIGRVIRHKDDYGAIILCDERFSIGVNKNQLSSWLQPHAKIHECFGTFQRDLIQFFKNSSSKYGKRVPAPKLIDPSQISSSSSCQVQYKKRMLMGSLKDDGIQPRPFIKVPSASLAKLDETASNGPNKLSLMDALKEAELKPLQPHHLNSPVDLKKYPPSSSCRLNLGSFAASSSSSGLTEKRKKILIINPHTKGGKSVTAEDYLINLKQDLSEESYSKFKKSIANYRRLNNFENFFDDLKEIFNRPCLHRLLLGMRRFMKQNHLESFYQYYSKFTGRDIPVRTSKEGKRSLEELSSDIQNKKFKQD